MTTSRPRHERRAGRAAIWRGADAPPVDLDAVQHGVRGRSASGSARIASGLIVLGMAIALLLFFVSDVFYVRSAAVAGNEFLTPSDVYTIAGIDSWHLFWLDPIEIRARLRAFPTIADAEVQVGWPPMIVQITVEEREPALVWERGGVPVWIDLQGRVMSQRAELTNLLRVEEVDSGEPLGPNMVIDPAIVSGALQLRQLVPELTSLRYHPSKGLGYNDPRGWEAWFGVGADMPEKMLNYTAIITYVQERNILPTEVNVSDPDAPFACCWTP